MKNLVKKYRLQVKFYTYNEGENRPVDNAIELIVAYEPGMTYEELDGIEREFRATYVERDVVILDSWYEMVNE